MKNLTCILLIGFALSLTFSSCSKKSGCTDPNSLNYDSSAEEDDGSCLYPEPEEPAKQRALILNSTATDCPNCGGWGTEYKNALLAFYFELDFIAIHSSHFESDISLEWLKDLQIGWLPHFWLGNEDLENDHSIIMDKVYQTIIQHPECGIQVSHSLNGSKMKIQVITQRENIANGNYNLAVYILENNHVANQSVALKPDDPNRVHNHILRREVSGEIYGKPIATQDLVTSNFEIDLGVLESINDNIIPENCYPLAVIWRNESGSFKYVNSNR